VMDERQAAKVGDMQRPASARTIRAA